MAASLTHWRLIRIAATACVACLALGHTLWFFSWAAAERRLHKGAERAALEATLPKSNRERVTQVAIEVLACEGIQIETEAVTLLHNGNPALQHLRAMPGDRFEVTITADGARLLSPAMARFGRWFGMQRIRTSAQRSL